MKRFRGGRTKSDDENRGPMNNADAIAEHVMKSMLDTGFWHMLRNGETPSQYYRKMTQASTPPEKKK
ncbi:hypothetical protein GN244_ATG01560 [Phytophthora infestans]|uniref:Uncharacterized protein n=1 Tax=Phytophthora infestans TaxID=4787 RepID=A0A833TSP2_PHYIN|nr:hypothetical protein GN244_ATG01560 [Phytophthora infestans]